MNKRLSVEDTQRMLSKSKSGNAKTELVEILEDGRALVRNSKGTMTILSEKQQSQMVKRYNATVEHERRKAEIDSFKAKMKTADEEYAAKVAQLRETQAKTVGQMERDETPKPNVSNMADSKLSTEQKNAKYAAYMGRKK